MLDRRLFSQMYLRMGIFFFTFQLYDDEDDPLSPFNRTCKILANFSGKLNERSSSLCAMTNNAYYTEMHIVDGIISYSLPEKCYLVRLLYVHCDISRCLKKLDKL